jgi:ferredoxin-NADP reductase
MGRTAFLECTAIAENTFSFAIARPDNFQFKAGQYVVIELPELSGRNRREFSIVSSPNRRDRLVFAFRDSESDFKKAIRTMKSGAEIELEGPFGLFTLPNERIERHFVFVAGGIGITPFMSMIAFSIEEDLLFHITLVAVNSSKERMPFQDELSRMQEASDKISVVKHIGKLNAGALKQYVSESVDRIFVAGPPGMVSEARQALSDCGVDENRILAEDFIGYA